MTRLFSTRARSARWAAGVLLWLAVLTAAAAMRPPAVGAQPAPLAADPLAVDEEDEDRADPLDVEGEQEEPAVAEEEEEEERPPGPRPDGPGDEEAAPPGGRPASGRSTSQGQSAGTAARRSQDAEDEFYDTLWWRKTYRAQQQALKIVPLREYLGKDLSAAYAGRPLKFQRFTHEGQLFQTLHAGQVVAIEYYEERLGDRAADLVGRDSLVELAQPGRPLGLSDELPSDAVGQAEQVLQKAIAQHDYAVGRGLRVGDSWRKRFRVPLVQALVNLRVGRIDRLIGQERYEQAEAECARLAEQLHPGDLQLLALQSRLERIFLVPAEAAWARGDYATARRLLEQLLGRLGHARSSKAQVFRAKLVARATSLLAEARLKRKTAPAAAAALLEEAAESWSSLPGLEELRARVDRRTLHCAYAELPRFVADQGRNTFSISPFAERIPAERHAASLIYERLARWVDDPQTGGHYEPQLAVGRPTSLPCGRQFRLPQCKWSDSSGEQEHYCIRDDVRHTVQIYCDPRLHGYCPAFRRLLAGVDNPPQAGAFGESATLALVRLSRDRWQPLSVIDFPILPRHRLPTPISWEQFDKRSARQQEDDCERFQRELEETLYTDPAGTGPYRLAASGHDADTLRLVANPHYRKPGRPQIREIVFYRLDSLQALDQFQEGKIDLIYDLRREHANQLDPAKVHVLRTPAVWFLAPNYQNARLADPNVRLAIAHAIDRRAILDAHFRGVIEREDSQDLTGPFPRKCWANLRDNRPQGYQDQCTLRYSASVARGYALKAVSPSRPLPVELTLVYPAGSSGDDAAEKACRQIRDQVRRQTGFTLQLQGEPPGRFYERIIRDHDFDLAYWCHHYEDTTYWLEPLFDPAPAARRAYGRNFMSYPPENMPRGERDELQSMFDSIRTHKSFRTIQEQMHEIHRHVYRKAIIIPLWQLHTYVAVSDSIPRDRLDPFVLFGGIEDWKTGYAK